MSEGPDLLGGVLPILQAARTYHRHEVVGMENLPKTGPALVVVNHSLATYDIVLLMTAIYTDFGRLPFMSTSIQLGPMPIFAPASISFAVTASRCSGAVFLMRTWPEVIAPATR